MPSKYRKTKKMMMTRISKNCRKPRARNPVERGVPSGVPFLLHIHHIACVFSRDFIQPNPKPYANYVAFNLHKIKARAITLSPYLRITIICYDFTLELYLKHRWLPVWVNKPIHSKDNPISNI